ncbi:MAG TPA: aminoglycoside phosphotransferase family protein [Chloroflexia bacterium]|nr:aminoglycoside phosphotransferase family protein [Chloroflexia bacterium]
MTDTLSSIRDWARTLPGLDSGPIDVKFKYERERARSYLLSSGETVMRLRQYIDEPGKKASLLERGARDAAQAEATALELYAVAGLAAQLVWAGELPGDIGGHGVVYRRIEGLSGDKAYLTEAHAERLGRALYEVHSHGANVKLIAPHPRNLAGWWNRVHEQYRDLPPEFLAGLPHALEESLVGLVQSVSGDANAHIRFWQGASLVPVHGSPAMRNVIMEDRRVTLVDWSRFGLGDPAFELAGAVWEMALSGGEALVEHLAGPYLRLAGDIMLERRVMIYRRLLPFGRFLELLHLRWRGEVLTAEQEKQGTMLLSAAMTVYGWPHQTVSETLAQFTNWLKSQPEKPTSM